MECRHCGGPIVKQGKYLVCQWCHRGYGLAPVEMPQVSSPSSAPDYNAMWRATLKELRDCQDALLKTRRELRQLLDQNAKLKTQLVEATDDRDAARADLAMWVANQA